MNRLLAVLALAGCSGSSTAPDARADAEPEVTPPAGVLAWFQLNGQFADIVNGVPMVLGGSLARFAVEGLHNGGGYLDGDSQRVLVDTQPRGVSLDFPGAFTVGLWIRPEEAPTDYGVIAVRSFSSADSSFRLVLDSTMHLRYDSQGGSSLPGTTQLQLNEWIHVALTFDGTTKRIFVGGALDATGPAAAPVTWDHEYIVFGAEGERTLASHYVTGTIDDIMLFDRAVSPTELAALAAQ